MAVDEERFVIAARISMGRKDSRNMNEPPQSTWVGGTQKGIIWFATQGLWLGDRKVGSQVVGKDRNRLPERGTVGAVRR